MRCEVVTSKKKRCTICGAVRDTDGVAKCHVHHPSLTDEQRTLAKRADRTERQVMTTRAKLPRRMGYNYRPEPPVEGETLPLKDRC